jgi:hypothetical protein
MTIRLFKRTITLRLAKRGRTTTLMFSVYRRATPHAKDIRWTAAPDGLWLKKKGNPIRIPIASPTMRRINLPTPPTPPTVTPAMRAKAIAHNLTATCDGPLENQPIVGWISAAGEITKL